MMPEDPHEQPKDVVRRLSSVEKTNERQWREISEMQIQIEGRLSRIEAQLEVVTNGKSKRSDHDVRVDRIWGVLQSIPAGAVVAVAIIAYLEYVG